MGKKYLDTKENTLESSILSVWAEAAKKEEKLDPVNPKAAKKKFDDRKDKDIDNDGDVDDSDEYLHNRRKTVSKAVKGKVKDEGNAFGKALKDAKDKGDKTFVVSGKTYEVTEADDFKPHMMYDPKTGKGYKADTMDDHLRMKKMGYTHDAPKKEEVELDEGKMKDLVIKGQDLEAYAKKSGGIDKKDMMNVAAMLKKGDKSGALKYAKKLDTDPRDYILDLMGEEVEVEEGAAADARRAMSKDKDLRRGKDSADVDDNASDDDVKGASKNIIMQMRKAQSLSGNFAVEFGDGKKVKIPAKMAVAVQKKYNSMKKPADKEKFQAQIAKSYKDMLKTLEAGYGEQKESILERMNRKIKENKDG